MYSLRSADRSVKLGAVLFLLVLGYAYVFAFLMVKTWSGLSPAKVAATYVPAAGVDCASIGNTLSASRSTVCDSTMPSTSTCSWTSG